MEGEPTSFHRSRSRSEDHIGSPPSSQIEPEGGPSPAEDSVEDVQDPKEGDIETEQEPVEDDFDDFADGGDGEDDFGDFDDGAQQSETIASAPTEQPAPLPPDPLAHLVSSLSQNASDVCTRSPSLTKAHIIFAAIS